MGIRHITKFKLLHLSITREVLSIMPKIPEISVGIQMERSLPFSSSIPTDL